MIDAQLFSSFARETRGLSLPGVLVESFPHFLRQTPVRENADGTVTFADLPPGREDKMIEEQVAHFSRLGRNFKWKVYALDRPADLRDRRRGADEPANSRKERVCPDLRDLADAVRRSTFRRRPGSTGISGEKPDLQGFELRDAGIDLPANGAPV